jgi:hypothetical protein
MLEMQAADITAVHHKLDPRQIDLNTRDLRGTVVHHTPELGG